jgi:hypothetical protein
MPRPSPFLIFCSRGLPDFGDTLGDDNCEPSPSGEMMDSAAGPRPVGLPVAPAAEVSLSGISIAAECSDRTQVLKWFTQGGFGGTGSGSGCRRHY